MDGTNNSWSSCRDFRGVKSAPSSKAGSWESTMTSRSGGLAIRWRGWRGGPGLWRLRSLSRLKRSESASATRANPMSSSQRQSIFLRTALLRLMLSDGAGGVRLCSEGGPMLFWIADVFVLLHLDEHCISSAWCNSTRMIQEINRSHMNPLKKSRGAFIEYQSWDKSDIQCRFETSSQLWDDGVSLTLSFIQLLPRS